ERKLSFAGLYLQLLLGLKPEAHVLPFRFSRSFPFQVCTRLDGNLGNCWSRHDRDAVGVVLLLFRLNGRASTPGFARTDPRSIGGMLGHDVALSLAEIKCPIAAICG